MYYFLRSRSAILGGVICGGGAGYHVVQASLDVDEDDLRLLIFLLPPSKSWDSMCAPSPVCGVLELQILEGYTSTLPTMPTVACFLFFSGPHPPAQSLSSADVSLAASPASSLWASFSGVGLYPAGHSDRL